MCPVSFCPLEGISTSPVKYSAVWFCKVSSLNVRLWFRRLHGSSDVKNFCFRSDINQKKRNCHLWPDTELAFGTAGFPNFLKIEIKKCAFICLSIHLLSCNYLVWTTDINKDGRRVFRISRMRAQPPCTGDVIWILCSHDSEFWCRVKSTCDSLTLLHIEL